MDTRENYALWYSRENVTTCLRYCWIYLHIWATDILGSTSSHQVVMHLRNRVTLLCLIFRGQWLQCIRSVSWHKVPSFQFFNFPNSNFQICKKKKIIFNFNEKKNSEKSNFLFLEKNNRSFLSNFHNLFIEVFNYLLMSYTVRWIFLMDFWKMFRSISQAVIFLGGESPRSFESEGITMMMMIIVIIMMTRWVHSHAPPCTCSSSSHFFSSFSLFTSANSERIAEALYICIFLRVSCKYDSPEPCTE